MEHFLWIDGQRSAQSKYIQEPFLEILSEFDTIIELGTFTGVFTKWLSRNAKPTCKIYTYDINPKYREVGDLKNTHFVCADVLEPSTIQEIKSIIKFGGRVLLLCDGGDKEVEFKLYSKFLKNLDVIMLHDYEHEESEYDHIKQKIGWTTISESKYKNLERYLGDLNLFPFYYTQFKEVLWGVFIKKERNNLSLSITTSKRLHLFEKTIESFCNNCEDLKTIKKIYHFDDSSDRKDLDRMYEMLRSFLPDTEIRNTWLDGRFFTHPKHHCEIMKTWLETVSLYEDYVFHLEDDWGFEKKFKIYELVDLLDLKPQVAYVGISQELRDFPAEIKVEQSTKFWKWHFDSSKETLSNLFLDKAIMKKKAIDGYWCYYINWPYFGFRPGVWDINKIKNSCSISCDSQNPFELDFALSLSKKYVSWFSKDAVCEHIGDELSAYQINSSER